MDFEYLNVLEDTENSLTVDLPSVRNMKLCSHDSLSGCLNTPALRNLILYSLETFDLALPSAYVHVERCSFQGRFGSPRALFDALCLLPRLRELSLDIYFGDDLDFVIPIAVRSKLPSVTHLALDDIDCTCDTSDCHQCTEVIDGIASQLVQALMTNEGVSRRGSLLAVDVSKCKGISGNMKRWIQARVPHWPQSEQHDLRWS